MTMTRSVSPFARIASITMTAWLLLCVPIVHGQEAPYRGPGGQLEAMGAIAAVFAINIATLDACARISTYKASAQRLGNAYVSRNKPIYVSVMQSMPALAQKSGGNAEVQRLKSELESGLTAIENFSRGAADGRAQKADGCSNFLKQIETKELDLRNTNTEHLRRLGVSK